MPRPPFWAICAHEMIEHTAEHVARIMPEQAVFAERLPHVLEEDGRENLLEALAHGRRRPGRIMSAPPLCRRRPMRAATGRHQPRIIALVQERHGDRQRHRWWCNG